MPTEEGYNGAYTGAQIDAAVAKANRSVPKTFGVTLTAAGWENNVQAVAATGVLADETKQLIYIIPAKASVDAYVAAGCSCIAQGANSLTFQCKQAPSTNLTVYITIEEVDNV